MKFDFKRMQDAACKSFLSGGAKRKILIAALILGLSIPVCVPGTAAVQSTIVYRRGGKGSVYEMLVTATRQKITLSGTEKMNNAIIGDVDGNGLEDEIVYTNASGGGLRYYKISGNGSWNPTLDKAIPNTPSNAVPLTVFRSGGTGTLGTIIYNSSGTTYRISPNGSGRKSMGTMHKAFAVDIRLRGYKGDLLWWTSGGGMRWRPGLTGSDRKAPYSDWIPLGGGQLYSNQPSKVIAFFASKDRNPKIYVCDQSFRYTRIDGTTWPWCTNKGALFIGEVDNISPLCEIAYVSSPTAPLKWYNPPLSTSSWDPNGVVTESSVTCGQNLCGIARVDITTQLPPPPPPPPPTTVSVSKIADLKAIADGTVIELAAKPRTKLVRELNSSGNPVVTGYYLEETDRSAGIRVVGSTTATEGQLISVTGTLSTLNGERIIMASGGTLSSTKWLIAPISTTVKALFGTVAMTGLFIQTTGTITSSATGSFTLTDSSQQSVKVYCADSVSLNGKAVDVKGCVGAEKTTSGAIVPVIRVESGSDVVAVNPSVPAKYSVWSTSPFDKVFKNDPVLPLTSYTVKAARNEHEPFQIVMRTTSTAVSGITLTANNLVSAGGAVIPASNVKLHLARYVYLPTLATDYPDPLPPYQGPFNMTTNQTQPIWVDIFVPKNVPAGDYRSSITISDASGARTDVPFVLHVYNFTLPDEWKHATSFGAYNWNVIADEHGVARGSSAHTALKKAYYEFMLDRGISVYKFPVDIMSPECDVYLTDPRLTSFEIPYYSDPAQQRAVLDKIKRLGVFHKGYYYPWDEPDTQSEYDRIMSRSNYIRSIDPNTKVICVFTVNPSWLSGMTAVDALENYCNIWCPKTSWMVSSVVSDLNRVRSKGHTIWSYYCWGVPRETWAQAYLDCASVAYPMVFWQNYNANVTGFLYWDFIFWQTLGDPWTDQQTYKSQDPGIYGEGSLVYPGSKVGINGPVSSIRLELMRGGLEDYQYFWLLEQKAGRSTVLSYINKVTTSYTNWSRDHRLFETTKDEIARMIE